MYKQIVKFNKQCILLKTGITKKSIIDMFRLQSDKNHNQNKNSIFKLDEIKYNNRKVRLLIVKNVQLNVFRVILC